MKRTRFDPQWFLSGAFFLAGVFLGGLGTYIFVSLPIPTFLKIHSPASSYKYINPLLAVDVNQEKNFSFNKALELGIRGLIDDRKRRGDIQSAAVYIRNIESGNWVGINENEKFSPGKLLKIPIMIAYFKLGEGDPPIFDEKIRFAGPVTTDTESPPTEQIEKGKEYRIDDLIERMFVYNDNNAANLLFDYIDKKTLNEVYSDLGVDFQEVSKETDDFISVKAYSLFFRVLYNATYLNRNSSEKALSILAATGNKTGLGAIFPKEIPIAESVGGRKDKDKGPNAVELSDCGIVYFPKHPHLFCIMVRGDSRERAGQWFKDVGRLLYDDIKYRYATE